MAKCKLTVSSRVLIGLRLIKSLHFKDSNLELTREVIATKHSQLCVSESSLEKTNEFFFQVKQ